MSNAPSTPNAGSSLVSSTIGAGVAEAEVVEEAEVVDDAEVDVGVMVEVTLMTSATKVEITVARFPVPETDVESELDVVVNTVMLGEAAVEDDAVDDCCVLLEDDCEVVVDWA